MLSPKAPELCRAMEDGSLRHPAVAAALFAPHRGGASADADALELRGGLAEWLALCAPPLGEGEEADLEAASHDALAGGDDVDAFESRGSGFALFLASRRHDVDPYEVRGGMAALCHEKVSPPLAAAGSLDGEEDLEADLYELRGGMASQAATRRFSIDFYEARGGMASWCSERPELPAHAVEGPAGELEADAYELRGGLASWLLVA